MRLMTALLFAVLWMTSVSYAAEPICPLDPDTPYQSATNISSGTLFMAPVSERAPYPYIVQNEETGERVNGYCVDPTDGYSEWLAWSPNRSLISLIWEEFRVIFRDTNPGLSLAQSDEEYEYYLRKDVRWFIPTGKWYMPSAEESAIMAKGHNAHMDITTPSVVTTSVANPQRSDDDTTVLAEDGPEIQAIAKQVRADLLALREELVKAVAETEALLNTALADNLTLEAENSVLAGKVEELESQNAVYVAEVETLETRSNSNTTAVLFIGMLLFALFSFYTHRLRRENTRLKGILSGVQQDAEEMQQDLEKFNSERKPVETKQDDP